MTDKDLKSQPELNPQDDKICGQLREAELRYRTLFEQSPDGILIIDTRGNILEFNETAHSELEYTREEFANLHLSDIDPVETPEDVQKRIEEALKKGKAEFEVKHKTKGGDVRDVHVITQAIDLGGNMVFHTIWRDVTERNRTEDKIRQSEERFRTLFESATDAVFVLSPEAYFMDMNRTAYERLGYTKEEMMSMHISQLAPAGFADRIDERIEHIMKHGQAVFESEHRMKDGTIMPVEINSRIIDYKGGKVIFSIVRDITQRKLSEKALRENEKFLQTIIETEPDCIKLLAADGMLLQMNRAGLAMIDADSLAQVKGQCLYPLVTPEYREAFKSLTDMVFKGGSGELEFEAVGIKNRRVRLETHAVPLRNDKDEIIALLGITRDVTGRKKMEEDLRSSRDFIERILDTVDAGFIVIDRDYRIIMANTAYALQAKMSVEEIIGKHCYEISHQSSVPCNEAGEECSVRHSFETGKPHSCVHNHTPRDGGTLYVETKTFPLKDASGNVTSVIEVINNITDRHLLEEQLLRTQKLEAVGLLAGGIAHDFNNLLQGVFGYIAMAKMKFDKKEKALEMLEQAEKALHMSVNLTTQLLTFSKGGKPVRKKIMIRPVIENAMKFALSGSRIDYSIEVDKALRMVEADEGQIGQVIQNIMLNADQAMPAGGAVSVVVKNVRAPEKGVPAILPGGNYIEIAIKDSGTGIQENYLSKIFDPYFTTREKGSGLGLATSYSIIKNHGGLIDVQSEQGKGSTFFVYLPAIEETEAEPGIVSAITTAVQKGRILVMDDEDLVRSIAGEMIRALGHDVEFAVNGEEAIAKYMEAMSAGLRFDIVILDLTIRGGMGGEEALKELLMIDPGVKAVVSSGYADSSTASEYEAHGFRACLIKPYKIDALNNMMSALLK